MKNQLRDTRITALLRAWATVNALVVEDAPEEDPLGILEACAEGSVERESERRAAERLPGLSEQEREDSLTQALKNMALSPEELREESVNRMRVRLLKELVGLGALEEVAGLIRQEQSPLKEALAIHAMYTLCDEGFVERLLDFSGQLNMSALERVDLLVSHLDVAGPQAFAYVQDTLKAYHPHSSNERMFAGACNILFAHTGEVEDLARARSACAAIQNPSDRAMMMRQLITHSRAQEDFVNAITAIDQLDTPAARSEAWHTFLMQVTLMFLLPVEGQPKLSAERIAAIRDCIPHQGWRQRFDELIQDAPN